MTRFPKSGRGRKWTVAEFKALPRKGDALADGDGLVGVVRLSTDEALRVHFRYGYKREGKRAWHYCGTWPSAPLDAIRRTRDHARDTLKRGLDPNAKREADHTGRRRAPARRGGIGVRAVRAVASRRRTAPGCAKGERYTKWSRFLPREPLTFSFGTNQVPAAKSTCRHSAMSSSPMRHSVDRQSHSAA